MSKPVQDAPNDVALLSGRVDQLLRAHIHNLQLPAPDEVRELVYELEQRRDELERQNQELVVTRQQLEAYRDRYVDLYDFAPLGYVTLDEDGFVQEINLAGSQMLGVAREELIGYAFGAHVAAADERRFLEHIRRCVVDGQQVVSELTLVAADGRPIAVQLRSIPVSEPAMQTTLCKTAMTDITERRDMEEAIKQSQLFLQTVIDAMPEAMLVIGRDYRIVLANRVARAMAGGVDPASACMTCYRVSHHRESPCQSEKDPCPLQQVIATKAPTIVTHTHYDAQGNEVFVEISAAPVFDSAGEVVFIIEACRDITERKRAEESLEAERNLLRTLLDNLPDYVYVKDTQGRFVAANLAVARVMGAATPADVLGRTDSDFYPEALAAEYRADEEALLRTGQPLVNKDEPHMDASAGIARAVITTKVPLKDARGKIVGLVGISRDITERKRAAEEVARAQQRVLELERQEKERVEIELSKARDALVRQTRMAAVGQLSGSIAHELRNPLASICNAVHLLRRKAPPEEPKCHEYLDIINSELLAANQIITDCVALSQGQSPTKRLTALTPILTQARSRVDAPEGIHWCYRIEREPFVIHADAVQLEQVFKNLFLNSIQALGQSGTITVEAVHAGEYDEIVVSDDGPGIRQEMRDRVFEPLVTTKSRGTGLGLTICRQIVEQHDGGVELLATGKPGAAFQIRLPVAPSDGGGRD